AKLELLCLGYGRTGTYSLKHALDMLGWPCYHSFLMGDKVLGHEMDAKLWDDVGKGNPNWNMLFEDFRAAADWPFITYWEQYLVLYPDAKVLLTLRDPESWYTSLLNSIAARPRLPYWLSYFGIKTPSMLHDLFVADKGFAQRSMEEHYAAVRRAVPRDRLLEFHVKEGWAPLCAFLGEDVPDVPFPRLNDGASYRSRL
ncbi:P-loop containing nucleoside triphosphate hydrolase protein, partial [Chytriomyces sp. MP71]